MCKKYRVMNRIMQNIQSRIYLMIVNPFIAEKIKYLLPCVSGVYLKENKIRN